MVNAGNPNKLTDQVIGGSDFIDLTNFGNSQFLALLTDNGSFLKKLITDQFPVHPDARYDVALYSVSGIRPSMDGGSAENARLHGCRR